MLLYITNDFTTAPASWSVLYDSKYSGKITVPDNPIQIADAALYLSKTQPSLGITDPYELTQPQFDATVSLLKQQTPADQEVLGPRVAGDLAVPEQRRSSARRGRTRPTRCKPAKAPVADTIPSAGSDGLGRQLAARRRSAPHPNCAYMWMQYITQPKPQAQQAISFGETPANKLACRDHGQAPEGLVRGATTPNAPEAYFNTIKFWKTPLAQCGNGKNDCVPFQKWVRPGPRSRAERRLSTSSASGLRPAGRRLARPGLGRALAPRRGCAPR